MEIHKPKAAHSFREFLIEIGTIVIGILIALGLEQAIEVIHERKIADEAREAVRAEVRENLWWVARSNWPFRHIGARSDAKEMHQIQ